MGIIYIAINLINGKQYVGQTIKTIKNRIKIHENNKNCSAFHNAIKKYGIKNFKIISYSCLEEDLDWHEIFLIKEFNTLAPNGYNLESGGRVNRHPHKITKKRLSIAVKKYYEEHPEVKEEIKKRNKKRFENPNEREKTRKKSKEWWSNHPEVKKKRSKKTIERYEKYPEIKKQQREKMLGSKNPFYKKQHDEKSLQKMRSPRSENGRLNINKNHYTKSAILISPQGEKFEIKGIAPFCKKYSLAPTSLCRVLQGKRKHHKGWTGKYFKEPLQNVSCKL
ncbi:MAG: GIY-YIG nuclease family protein [Patescibacteria group bacterium]|jgi:group I intron endonuclease